MRFHTQLKNKHTSSYGVHFWIWMIGGALLAGWDFYQHYRTMFPLSLYMSTSQKTLFGISYLGSAFLYIYSLKYLTYYFHVLYKEFIPSLSDRYQATYRFSIKSILQNTLLNKQFYYAIFWFSSLLYLLLRMVVANMMVHYDQLSHDHTLPYFGSYMAAFPLALIYTTISYILLYSMFQLCAWIISMYHSFSPQERAIFLARIKYALKDDFLFKFFMSLNSQALALAFVVLFQVYEFPILSIFLLVLTPLVVYTIYCVESFLESASLYTQDEKIDSTKVEDVHSSATYSLSFDTNCIFDNELKILMNDIHMLQSLHDQLTTEEKHVLTRMKEQECTSLHYHYHQLPHEQQIKQEDRLLEQLSILGEEVDKIFERVTNYHSQELMKLEKLLHHRYKSKEK